MDLGLAGKRVVVTGGSRGIGRATVLAMAGRGAVVASCYHREGEAVTSLGAELGRLGRDNILIRADVSDEGSVARFLAAVRTRLGGVDVLVNNAGVVSHRTLTEMDLSEWRRVVDTNLTSMYMVTRAALDAIPRGGSVINVTSAVATVGMVGRAHYTASKSGVLGLTRSLCKELGQRGIRVNAVAPGIIETDQAAGLTAEQRTRYSNLAALGRLGRPEDVADVILFLASDLSGFVSGVTLHVDGGI